MVYLEQYRIGIEVEPSVSHMAIGHPFFLFYSFGHSALFGFCAAAAKVSVILCPRCANMATANKYNQLMERERVSFSYVHSPSTLLTKLGENGTRLRLSSPFTKIPHGLTA